MKNPKEYRARFDSSRQPPHDGSMWLGKDMCIHVDEEKAAVLSLYGIVNLIAKMVFTNPVTVRDGDWVLEEERVGWMKVK